MPLLIIRNCIRPPCEKAAAILESILINHPFVDGNKRTAYVLMTLILLENGMTIDASQEDKYNMVIAASTGNMRFDEIRNWIQSRLKNLNKSFRLNRVINYLLSIITTSKLRTYTLVLIISSSYKLR